MYQKSISTHLIFNYKRNLSDVPHVDTLADGGAE